MWKNKKIKIGKRIIEFDDIRKATESEPEPHEELKGAIPNGRRLFDKTKIKQRSKL